MCALYDTFCFNLSTTVIFDSSGILKVFSVKVRPSYKKNYMLQNYLDTWGNLVLTTELVT